MQFTKYALVLALMVTVVAADLYHKKNADVKTFMTHGPSVHIKISKASAKAAKIECSDTPIEEGTCAKKVDDAKVISVVKVANAGEACAAEPAVVQAIAAVGPNECLAATRVA